MWPHVHVDAYYMWFVHNANSEATDGLNRGLCEVDVGTLEWCGNYQRVLLITEERLMGSLAQHYSKQVLADSHNVFSGHMVDVTLQAMLTLDYSFCFHTLL